MSDFYSNGKDTVVIPASQIPNFRFFKAHQRGVHKKLLFKLWGGLGDQLCAEPTLRFALEQFKDCEISLATDMPSLFSHLNFKKIYDTKKEQPNEQEHYTLYTIVPQDNLTWEFFSHMITNCVDFCSLCSIRCQLPISYKGLQLVGKEPKFELCNDDIFVHAGRHWETKTFPKDWWDKVLSTLIEHNKRPILIGADTDDNRGTVNVNTNGCIDLRNKLSISESIWLLQRSKVLLTNDSSPLHMAASEDPSDKSTGECEIGYIATAKHPDFISHWRKGKWSYKMINHGNGGMWDLLDICPNKENEVSAEHVSQEQLLKWLPDPTKYAMWAVNVIGTV